MNQKEVETIETDTKLTVLVILVVLVILRLALLVSNLELAPVDAAGDVVVAVHLNADRVKHVAVHRDTGLVNGGLAPAACGNGFITVPRHEFRMLTSSGVGVGMNVRKVLIHLSLCYK